MGTTDQLGRVDADPAEARPSGPDEVLAQVYESLRSLARERLARAEAVEATGGSNPTLHTTALVHEAWLQVARSSGHGWESAAQFHAAAANAMRLILVDHARRRSRLKRGAGFRQRFEVDLEEASGAVPLDGVLAIDAALARLERSFPLKAKIVSLRFFAGLTMPAIASALGLSLRRVEREWRFARAWLQRELDGADE